MIGCGFTALRFEEDTNMQGVSAYLLDAAPSQRVVISKKEIKELLTHNELADPNAKYVPIYFALNYRFFSEGSLLFMANEKETNIYVKPVFNVFKNPNDKKFYVMGNNVNSNTSVLVENQRGTMTFRYPEVVAQGASPTMILEALLDTPLGIRDRLTFKFSREVLMDESKDFKLTFIRGSLGRDNYEYLKGRGALFKNTYFVGEVLGSNFTIPKEKSNEEKILVEWDDSLIGKQVRITFNGLYAEISSAIIKVEKTTYSSSFTYNGETFKTEVSLFKSKYNLVCIMKSTHSKQSPLPIQEDTEVREIKIIG